MKKFYTENQIKVLINDYCDFIQYNPKVIDVGVWYNRIDISSEIVIHIDGFDDNIQIKDSDWHMNNGFAKYQVKHFIRDTVKEAKKQKLILELAGVE